MEGLNSFNSWTEKSAFSASHSAQGYLNSNAQSFASLSGGSGCGSGDKTPSSCGAGDDKKESDDDTNEKTTSCGTSCGAGDEEKEKSSSCGSSCGAGEK